MNTLFATLTALALVALPLALAHNPAGTPDRFCTGPTLLHDYGPMTSAAPERTLAGVAESAATVDTDLSSVASSPNREPHAETPPASNEGPIMIQAINGNLEECGTTGGIPFYLYEDLPASVRDRVPNPDRTADYDGEPEYAPGGAVFAAQDPASTICYNIPAHHGLSPIITAEDIAQIQVSFFVVSDWAPTGQDAFFFCGDGLADPCDPTNPTEVPDVTCNPRDQQIFCTGSCAVPFPPGQDGIYFAIMVQPFTQGHLWST